ncbi:MAG TPA: hypothetical protein VNJ11_04095 [Bryobacteraceae bacterium]|nr:hypothetical protein [Bryobacteraceae bacterium]
MRVGGIFLGVSLVAAAQTESPITRQGAFWVQTVRGEIAADPTSLRISCPGPLSVQGVEGLAAIRYVLTRRARTADAGEAQRLLRQITFHSTATRSGTAVWVRRPAGYRTSCELAVEVPPSIGRAALTAETGSVRVSGLRADVEVATVGGRIWLDRIDGNVTARTGGGDVEVGVVDGVFRCQSGGGSIRARRIGRDARLETAGGEIIVAEIGGKLEAVTAGGNILVERAASAVTANTAGGLITVRQAGGIVTGSTGAGAIRVGPAAGVRAESAGGPIEVRGISGPVRVSTLAGSIVAELSRADFRESYLKTRAGDVTVFIPSNLAVTIRALNESPWRLKQIVSDFRELAVKPAGAPGVPLVIAEGALNGGGPLLEISAAGGTIYLRRK